MTRLFRVCAFLLVLLAGLVALAPAGALAQATPAPRDGQHDFDFELGDDWTVRISRLVGPLTGSTTWTDYEGISILRPVWNGRANLGEIDVSGPSGRIVGLSLRTYNPATGQWYITWTNSADGVPGPPMIGGFENGIGRFHNQEMFRGKPVFVRFIFDEITPTTFRLVQAFSDDGGVTWEDNWIARFTR